MENIKRKSTDLRNVQEILQKWDPIGVIESLKEYGLPPNEYDSYAPAILVLLQNGCTIKDLTRHLGTIQSISMGLGPSPDHDEHIASTLMKWWNSR